MTGRVRLDRGQARLRVVRDNPINQARSLARPPLGRTSVAEKLLGDCSTWDKRIITRLQVRIRRNIFSREVSLSLSITSGFSQLDSFGRAAPLVASNSMRPIDIMYGIVGMFTPQSLFISAGHENNSVSGTPRAAVF